MDNTTVIDAHTHILPDEFKTDYRRFAERDATFGELFGATTPPNTVGMETLRAEMDAAGIDVAVAAGYGWNDYETARLSNDYLIHAGQQHPRHIIPFCSVNPLWGKQAIDEVERCAALGARGIGELHPDSQNLLDAPFSYLVPLMDCARVLDLPVMFHASEPVGHSYPGKGTVTPQKLMALISTFADNKFIFAHFGGGLPFYALMPEVKKALANVWFDSAAYNFLYHPNVFKVCADSVGVEHILFGSDFPLIKQRRALNGLNDNSALTDEQRAQIAGGNAKRLFNLTT